MRKSQHPTSPVPFDAAVHTLVDALLVADDTGTILYANPAACTTFGYETGGLAGRPLVTIIPERFREAHAHGFARFLATGEARVLGKRLELTGLREDETEFPLELTITHLEDGETSIFTSLVRDISDRKRREQRAAENERRADEVDHLRAMQDFKTRFINQTAHELGTPLTPIRLQTDVLSRKLDSVDDPAFRTGFRMLARNVNRLSELVDGIVDAAMIQSRSLGLNRQTFDLATVVEARVDEIRARAELKGIQITSSTNSELMVDADPARISRVIGILLSNAVRFNNPGGDVRVEAYHGRDGVVVRVADTGVGIAPERIAQLFTPYDHAEDAHTGSGGSGLGLYVAKGIVDLHGGQIWCESDGAGQGAEFFVALPEHAPENAVAADVAARSRLAGD